MISRYKHYHKGVLTDGEFCRGETWDSFWPAEDLWCPQYSYILIDLTSLSALKEMHRYFFSLTLITIR